MSGYVPGKVTEEIANGEVDALIGGVLTNDKQISRALLAAERGGLDGDDALVGMLDRSENTHSLREARKTGDYTTMNAATGLSDSSVDMSDWKQIQVVQDLFRKQPRVRKDLTNAVFQCVLFSGCVPPTGRGKTSTSYFLVENAEIVRPGISVMTNNPSDEYPNVPEQWEDLKNEIRETDGWSLVMLDEAAQFLQYADQGAGKAVSQLMKLLRHNQCHLILVGHTGMDVPADIRRQMFFIDKKSQKTAVLGYGLQAKTGDNRMEVADEILTMNGVPHTSVNYESQGEEAISIKFDEDDEDEDEEDEPMCRAEKKSGGDCPQAAVFPRGNPVVCHGHRGEMDDFLDDDEDDEDELNNDTSDDADVQKSNEEIIDAMVEEHGAEDAERMLRTIIEQERAQ